MIGGLTFRCSVPGQTRAEALRSALWLAGLTIALSALFVAMKRLYGSTLWVEAIGFAALPLSLSLWSAQAYLRNRSWTTRALLVALVTALAFFGAWLSRAI